MTTTWIWLYVGTELWCGTRMICYRDGDLDASIAIRSLSSNHSPARTVEVYLLMNLTWTPPSLFVLSRPIIALRGLWKFTSFRNVLGRAGSSLNNGSLPCHQSWRPGRHP